MRNQSKTYTLLFLSTFMLSGCFGGSQNANEATGNNTINRFEVEGSVFSLNLPSTWTRIQNAEKNTIFTAQNVDQNLVIIAREGKMASPQALLETAQKQFFTFEVGETGSNFFEFKGKIQSTTPERVFWQKFIDIPNSNYYLVASCSYEFLADRNSSCESIIKGWNLTS